MPSQSPLVDLKPCVNRLNVTVNTLSGLTKLDRFLNEQLRLLYHQLQKLDTCISDILSNSELTDDLTQWDVSLPRQILQQLVDDLKKVDPTLSHVLDILELEQNTANSDITLSETVDLIEECTTMAHRNLDSNLKELKIVSGVFLEFTEIVNDNMTTLQKILDENIEQLFEIQEKRFESPVRHIPSFTLDQLLSLLTRNVSTGKHDGISVNGNGLIRSKKPITNDTTTRLPKFSLAEERLVNGFMAIQKNLKPIQKSLLDVLPERSKMFSARHKPVFEKIGVLDTFLSIKYKRMMKDFKFLEREVYRLKVEIIDKRWNILFTNLNHELQALLSEMNEVYKQCLALQEEDTNDKKLRKRFEWQLERNTTVVTRTFNVIYTASEFSLLSPEVAKRTNELAQWWIDLRPKTDELLTSLESTENMREMETEGETLLEPPPILFSKNSRDTLPHSDSESDAGNKTIEAIAGDLRKFSLGSGANRTSSGEQIDGSEVNSGGPKIGATLLRKVSVKPLDQDGIDGDDEENPFFHVEAKADQPQNTKKNRRARRSLIFSPIPKLPFYGNSPISQKQMSPKVELTQKPTSPPNYNLSSYLANERDNSQVGGSLKKGYWRSSSSDLESSRVEEDTVMLTPSRKSSIASSITMEEPGKIEALLTERAKTHATKPSQIPKLGCKKTVSEPLPFVKIRPSLRRTPQPQSKCRIKPPTPLSQLLSTQKQSS
ncbi:Kar9p KNAG_0E02810 [Huiozyma naganishii CBS 8797]|uniref:Karyogamy protein KAR9 n=1 Tax=Huiozyma naganishii (strain ATCC MYA-139 / BCRC 22969 / CBS 8797 / KCTC 17520 / NBRC 10181 / NCYC 3082 / Yp74L-3) TaxID=1071383 RepID=J7R6R6_HUIN7|nr:hypothetical protein KNAG_0E02810 [Kazachstania naganishii CBS 8797]CCK70540.1 hypothetical protein KNAG_0E02810 [Kazachstania naganishii CBS 8797]